MKYELDCKTHVIDSLLFWIEKFVVYKVSTLSRRHIENIDKLNIVMEQIKEGTESIEELSLLVKKARNLGAISMHTYFNPLQKLLLYIQKYDNHISTLKNIDEEYIIEFLLDACVNYAAATKKNYRVSIINFFKYIDKQNINNGIRYMFDIELKHISWITKGGIRLPTYLDDDNLKIFFDGLLAYSKQSSKCFYRNATMIYVILNTGLRASEVINLRVKDVSITGSFYVLTVIGKGNKERKVLLENEVLEKYLSTININDPQSLIFTNLKGNALHQSYLHRQIMHILDMTGIKTEKKGAHLLRHTFATRLYMQTKDLVLVQEIMGHGDINTTRIYTHFDNSKLEGSLGLMKEFTATTSEVCEIMQI